MTALLLDGKVVLITGGASGIGAAAATVFAGHGAAVVVSDINGQGEEVADSVVRSGGAAVFVRADVTSPSDVSELVRRTVATFGRLDCAFNNAGIEAAPSRLHQVEEANWDRVLGVNLKAVWLCMKEEIAQMLGQHHGGSIVNVSSTYGLKGSGLGMGPYVAAKHGVIGLTRAAALEYATERIRVNALCPGGVRTPMVDTLISQGLVSEDDVHALHPTQRMGDPVEIAEAAAWLCSDAASFVTGHPMAVDGGMAA
jgi:NAD(P)-dependent dehydrogenase (short-subunit alcohol dehydrogenase family)